MSLTVITADIHCGQTYESYASTARERLDKANNCIATIGRFQHDHRNDIERVIIAGDLCQRTGARAANTDLEDAQLYLLGKGMQHHDADILYVAGSADPYFDEDVMGMPLDNVRSSMANAMDIDCKRLRMPGLIYKEETDSSTLIATHGHLPELVHEPKEYVEYLLNPTTLSEITESRLHLEELRRSEDEHQKKGMIYEWGYRNVIRRLPLSVAGIVDRTLMKKDSNSSIEYIRSLGLPDHSMYCFGHIHVPINEQVDSVRVINPGSLTGSFRMNPREPGTFATIDNLGTPASQNIRLWTIRPDGEYEEREEK